jgi:hypothetical protein
VPGPIYSAGVQDQEFSLVILVHEHHVKIEDILIKRYDFFSSKLIILKMEFSLMGLHGVSSRYCSYFFSSSTLIGL